MGRTVGLSLAEAIAIEFMTPPPPGRNSVFSNGPPTLVDLGDAALVHYWCSRFGTSEARLREAIREVGRDHQLVQLYLSRESWPQSRNRPQ